MALSLIVCAYLYFYNSLRDFTVDMLTFFLKKTSKANQGVVNQDVAIGKHPSVREKKLVKMLTCCGTKKFAHAKTVFSGYP